MQLTESAAAAVRRAFADDAKLLDLARRTLTAFPEFGADRYTDEDLAQLLRGFGGLAAEALDGRTSETRDLFMSTAIPAVVTQGETVATLARSTTVFGILLTDEICRDLTGDDRHAAVAWLARFFGQYAHDAVAAARAAEDAR